MPCKYDFAFILQAKIYKCSQLGSEKIVAARLLLLPQARHELRHAFTLADARGYIYLEGSLNPYLLHLLRRIPGVVFRGNELVRTAIEKSELIKLLKAKPAVRSNFTQGQWVRVTRGVYKGDIGLIDSIHDWGAEVLLIPRIPYCAPDRKGKRKASPISNAAKLFDSMYWAETCKTNISLTSLLSATAD